MTARRRSLLPALPKPNGLVKAAQVLAIERHIVRVVNELDNIHDIEEWRARARAIEAYLRGPEMQRPMLGAQRRVEARIGQLLGPANLGELSHGISDVPKRPNDRLDCRVLARALAGECTPSLTDDEWRKSRRALVALVRYRLGLMPETPPFPEGSYHCIVADPPWQLDTGPDHMHTTGEAGHDALSYSQLSLEAIRNLRVEQLAAPDAHLYLWTTNRYVEAAYDIARAWDFQPSALLVWCKAPRGVGLGDTFRHTAEYILFARRGSLKARRIVETTWFDWPRSRHSVKPDGFYDLVESVTPPPYLDLFARRARDNWTIWGAEAPTSEGVA